MKKITLLLFILTAYLSTAQTIYFEDDFNDKDISDWTVVDADGDFNAWYIFGITDGSGYVYSNSWYNVALTPDNFLISPPIDLSSASSSVYLNWVAGGLDYNFAAESYTVYAGTSPDVTAMTANAISFSENIGDDPEGTGKFAHRTLDISSLAGESTIYVAFRHHNSTGQNYLSIDNVSISSESESTPKSSESCETAMPIAAGVHFVAGINSFYDIPFDCIDTYTAFASVWYSFTADADGEIKITTDLAQNEGANTTIHVYSGVCGSLNCLGGSDDIEYPNVLSEVTINGKTGTTYLVAFDNTWGSTAFDFEITGSLLGIEGVSNLNFYKFYNPSTDALVMKSNIEIEQVQIYNLAGQKLINKSTKGQETTVEMSQLASGLYIAQVKMGNKIETFKIVKP